MTKGPGIFPEPLLAESEGIIFDPLKTPVFQRFRAPPRSVAPIRAPIRDAALRSVTRLHAKPQGLVRQSYDSGPTRRI